MPDPFASMTPNVIAAGEKLSVTFASSSPEFKDATEVEVRITEVDDASPLEPKGANKVLATFLGKLSDNKFTLEKPSKDNPKLPAVTPGAPHDPNRGGQHHGGRESA